MFQSKIVVTLRKSILDPQGKAVEQGVHSLGYEKVNDVRIGKFIELNVQTDNKVEAERITKEVCEKLLANPIMEDFSFTVENHKAT
ncbi:MAG: phosphoribosylformylglycinamidine synthase subunit PurS [Ignavibacteriales bacterium]|nr:phosphoribosylformylglycinamidine synthase subunit PurS [Ignavibacteriales bacterium]